MNLFEAIFKNNPSAPAICYANSEILNYGELRTRTLNLAQKLAFLRTTPGDRVALLVNDSPEFVEAFIAIVSMGAIAVPINMALALEDQCSILHNSGARVALVEQDFCSKLLTADPERLQFLTDILSVDRNDDLVAPVGSHISPAGDHFSITEMRVRKPPLTVHSLSGSGLGPQPAFRTPVNDEPSLILYTSGSTGDPKGAIHRQSDIFYTNEGFCRQVLKLTPNDRLFSSSRLPFAYGLGNALTFPLINGATTILCSEKPTPKVIARVFTRNRPTIFFAVPVVYSLLLEHYRRTGQLDCSSLRMCVSAGEALPAQLGREWEKVFGVELLDGIGSTELLHMFMSNREKSVRYGSSGQLIDGYEARLVDDQGQPVADNTEGHLWIKGESAAIGYWEKPAETARTFVDGWVRTGDLYRRTHDGYWFHMGRSDDCFKSSGQWVSPVEVEGVLLSHVEVARAAVVADFDENQLPCGCAFVVKHDVKFDSDRLEKELRELTRASLPRFKQPGNYRFVSELPYTATGKIQRFKLRDEIRKRSG